MACTSRMQPRSSDSHVGVPRPSVAAWVAVLSEGSGAPFPSAASAAGTQCTRWLRRTCAGCCAAERAAAAAAAAAAVAGLAAARCAAWCRLRAPWDRLACPTEAAARVKLAAIALDSCRAALKAMNAANRRRRMSMFGYLPQQGLVATSSAAASAAAAAGLGLAGCRRCSRDGQLTCLLLFVRRTNACSLHKTFACAHPSAPAPYASPPTCFFSGAGRPPPRRTSCPPILPHA